MASNRMRAARLAWRHGRRALAAGDGWILLIALVVAVAAVAAVNQITARVRLAMVAQSAQTLGGDLRADLTAPLDGTQKRRLAGLGVQTAAVSVFPSVATHGDALALVSVAAVTRAYPLRGALTLRRGPPGSRITTVGHGPRPGTVWVGQRVLDKLGLAVGGRLALGDIRPRIGAVIVAEPDRGAGLVDFAPRLLMARTDLGPSGLVGPGSRIHYHELIAGPPARIAAAKAALAPTLGPDERLQTPAEANRGLARAIARAGVFLDLAALVAVALAGVAIALTATAHAKSRLDEIALLKTLGAARGQIARLLAWQLVYLGALGIGAGLAVGYAAQLGMGLVVSRLFAIALPAAGIAPLWPAPAVGGILLAGFAWPALAGARRAPPARVLARALGADCGRTWPVYAGALASVAVLAAAATRDLALTLRVLGTALTAALVFVLAAWAALWCIERLRKRMTDRLGPGPRLGLAALSRRRAATVIQTAAFGIGLTFVFMLVLVRGDLLADWQANIAANAPNRFLINITPGQTGAVGAYLSSHGISRPHFYPVVRGRLTQVDGRSLDSHKALADSAGELARRALNLSWAAHLKADNRIVAGHWWQASGTRAPPISIDQSVAKRLHVGIGDTLTFAIAGRRLTARIASIRAIDWSTLQANFYVFFAPGALAAYPASYITSFYLPDAHRAALAGLARRFPNISVIDIAAILAQIETLIKRVSLAVEMVFGFTLAAAVVVLTAAVGASRAQRVREAALLKALGARAGGLRLAAATEYLIIGALSSVLAAIAAQSCAVLLATQVLHLDYQVRWGVWCIAITAAALAIAGAGVLSLGAILRAPAWQSLRDTD